MRRAFAVVIWTVVTLLSLAAILVIIVVLAIFDRGEYDAPPLDVKLLATDIYFSVAQHTLVFPFVAMDNYAYRQYPSSLYPRVGRKGALDAIRQFVHETADPKKPLVLDGLSVWVHTYGWNDGNPDQRQVCRLLTREWSRSMCDNPWAAIQQALPHDRFKLVDLSRLQVDDPRDPTNCRNNGKPHQLPRTPQEAVIVCERDTSYTAYTAAVRIDGDLGAVWGPGNNELETAETTLEREGKAVVAFVKYAIGQSEDFPALHAAMCDLRRPGSKDSPDPKDLRCPATPDF